MKRNPKKTVYVAMSGGVDSSVAAALLKKQGFDVVGVFMKPWQAPAVQCLWQKDKEDALRVAAILDIPLLVWDFSREYGRKVARYMIEGYRKGITPNPDVMCNKEIKFGLFFERAMREGADCIATGHYARIKKHETRDKKNKKLDACYWSLVAARDSAKDQSYFLWTLTQGQLSKTLFPIGGYAKPEVRRMAKRFGLPTFDKKDSQGVCFVGPLQVKDFLKRSIKPRRGKIIDMQGNELGTHDGAAYYTIGQRHGLNISLGGGPYYVVRKDMKKNDVTVGIEKDLYSDTAAVRDVHWIRPGAAPARLDVKVRYRAPSQKAVLRKDGRLVFAKSQRAVSPGQSAVFYRGKECLGGGILE